MNKKIYHTPKVKVFQIDTTDIIASSNTGATGEDIPWASPKSRSTLFGGDSYEE